MKSLRHLPALVLLAATWPTSVLATGPAPAARMKAEQAFARLHERVPAADASWKDGQPGPEVVAGLDVDVSAARTPELRARAFLAQWPDLLGIPSQDLRFVAESRSQDRVVARFVQTVDTPVGRLPVHDRFVAVTLDAAGHVVALASDAMPAGALAPATVSATQAKEAALRLVTGVRPGAPVPELPLQMTRVVVAHPHHAFIAWAVDVTVTPRVDRRLLLVDAATGRVVHQQNLVRR